MDVRWLGPSPLGRRGAASRAPRAPGRAPGPLRHETPTPRGTLEGPSRALEGQVRGCIPRTLEPSDRPGRRVRHRGQRVTAGALGTVASAATAQAVSNRRAAMAGTSPTTTRARSAPGWMLAPTNLGRGARVGSRDGPDPGLRPRSVGLRPRSVGLRPTFGS